MTDPTQPLPKSDDRPYLSYPAIDFDVNNYLDYPQDDYDSQANEANMEPEEDILDVLDALIDLHDLQNSEYINYEQDCATIDKAIQLNDEMQRKVEEQIRIIDERLKINTNMMTEARNNALAENRFGQRMILHKEYEDCISYFDETELIKTDDNAKSDMDFLQGDEESEEEDDNGSDNDDEHGDDEEEEEEEDTNIANDADNEKNYLVKAWTRLERERLEAGIHSEAKRAMSFDYMKRNEVWRVWEVDKMDPKELSMFPVSRINWERISNLHVYTRSPTECLIQWTTQEHPSINKKPWSKQESLKLNALVEEVGLFSGQWERIASELDTNRTISQCFSHYMSEKNNKYARSLKWSKEEDEKLRDAVKLFGNCNWQQVASNLPGRTGQQCLHRWLKSLNPAIKRRRWEAREDALLKRAVHLYGAGNWTKIQRLIPGRTDMQCRERWVNILQPSVNREPFTEEEMKRLLELVEEHGPKWSLIARHMPGRTDNIIMRCYHKYINQKEMDRKREEREQKSAAAKEKRKEKKKAPDTMSKKARLRDSQKKVKPNKNKRLETLQKKRAEAEKKKLEALAKKTAEAAENKRELETSGTRRSSKRMRVARS